MRRNRLTLAVVAYACMYTMILRGGGKGLISLQCWMYVQCLVMRCSIAWTSTIGL